MTAIIALYVVVASGGSDPTGSDKATKTAGNRGGTTTTTTKKPKPAAKQARSYTVQPGDTPSGIAEKTGVPLDTLLELNPDVDPQLLSPGQRLKLSS